jgi:ribosomal protein L37E
MDMRPALPVLATEDLTRVRVDTRTGTQYQELELVYTEYDIGRIKEGYCCIECGEAQVRPFPPKCSVCGFPMKDEQTRQFGLQFDGVTTTGQYKSLEELRAEDEEAKEKARRAREGKPTSSALLPKSIWLPF